MEAIAPHAAIGDRLRQRERLRHFGLRAVERRVETGDLGQLGAKFRDDLDRLEVVWLVQGREWAQLRELGDHFGVDTHGLRERLAAMHDAVAHGNELVASGSALEKTNQIRDGAAVPELGALVPG